MLLSLGDWILHSALLTATSRSLHVHTPFGRPLCKYKSRRDRMHSESLVTVLLVTQRGRQHHTSMQIPSYGWVLYFGVCIASSQVLQYLDSMGSSGCSLQSLTSSESHGSSSSKKIRLQETIMAVQYPKDRQFHRLCRETSVSHTHHLRVVQKTFFLLYSSQLPLTLS